MSDPVAKRRQLADRLDKARKQRDAARTQAKRDRYSDRVMTIGREMQRLNEQFPPIRPLRLFVADR